MRFILRWVREFLGFDFLFQQVSRLTEENRELRDRLYMTHHLPVSGSNLLTVPTNKGEVSVGWMPPKKRVASFIQNQEPPLVAQLSNAEIAELEKRVNAN